MDLVIPGIALSMLYVATKQNKEAFRSKLPNVDVPDKNYPEQYPVQSPELDLTSELSTNNKYDNAGGSYTDKYFNANMNQSTFPSPTGSNVNKNTPMYYSLTGDKVDASYFQHNNMVPYFGSNTRTPIANKNNFESLLDSYTGSGSQSITKKEQSP